MGVRRNDLFGVNVADTELAPHAGQTFPTLSQYQYLAAKGVGFQRLPFALENVMPILLGSLDTTQMGYLTQAIDNAWACGISTILDMHNFAHYVAAAQWATTIGYPGNAGNVTTGVSTLGDATFTSAALVDAWQKIATALVGRAGLIGYDIMNEPGGMTGVNLLTTPNYFGSGYDWFTDGAATVTKLAEGTNPLGVNYGPAWNLASGGAVPDLGQSFSYSALTYCLSVYAKCSTGTQPLLLLIAGTASSSKTVTTSWQRFEFSRTTIVANAANKIKLNAGSGNSIQLANAQFEVASTASAYEPNPWFPYAQAVITAIRVIDATTPIYVEGYSNRASSWVAYNGDMAALSGSGLTHSAHNYFDGPQGVGGGSAYSGSYASYSINAQSGVECITPFADWCTAHGAIGYLGEFGIPGADANWQTLQNNAVTYMRTKSMKATQWFYGASVDDGDPLNFALTPGDARLIQMLAR